MTDESIADQLLRRKNELIEGWDEWVPNSPALGEQCAVVDCRQRNRPARQLSMLARGFACSVLNGRYLEDLNDDSGPDYRTVVLDALDRCIAEAKDRGI